MIKTPNITSTEVGDRRQAKINRQTLKAARAFTVSILGGPGCGKTLLLDDTIQRLLPNRRVAVISADSPATCGPDHLARHAEKVLRVRPNGGHCLDARDVHAALSCLALRLIDILFIENVGSLTAPATDLGQDATITIFSVAAGDDKAEKHKDLVKAADAIILNKIDLLSVVPFDLARFRADVHRANPAAELFELSALNGAGTDPWLDWLKRRSQGKKRDTSEPSHWFG